MFEISGPKPSELAPLLRRFLPPPEAEAIANFACGNVRLALCQAQTALQS